MATSMLRYWGSFVSSGRPDDGILVWPPYRPNGQSVLRLQHYPSRVIHALRFNATFNITRELLTKNHVLSRYSTGRAQERGHQPQDVRDYSDDCARQLQHAVMMPESAHTCSRTRQNRPRLELLRTTSASDSAKCPTALTFLVDFYA
jgi:hypothetical protein